MKLIDVHTHLSSSEFDADRSEVLTRAFQVCDAFIDIGAGTSPDAFAKAQALAESDSRIFFTAGVHPHDAQTLGLSSDILQAIEIATKHNKCVAVGECGLDYFYKHSPREEQIRVFRWQIELARQRGLPLMIHTRDAEADTMAELASYQGGAVFHCFTGSQELADFGVKKGFMISFSGIVTFKKADELRKVFMSVPPEQILVETDSPYLAPIPHRGQRNESSFVEHTAKFLAELRGMKFEEMVRLTHENSRRVFNKIKLS